MLQHTRLHLHYIPRGSLYGCPHIWVSVKEMPHASYTALHCTKTTWTLMHQEMARLIEHWVDWSTNYPQKHRIYKDRCKSLICIHHWSHWWPSTLGYGWISVESFNDFMLRCMLGLSWAFKNVFFTKSYKQELFQNGLCSASIASRIYK